MFTFFRAAVFAPMGEWWAVDEAALMLVVVRTQRKLEFDAQRAEGTAGCRGWVGCKLQTGARVLVHDVQAYRADSTPLLYDVSLGRPLGSDKGTRCWVLGAGCWVLYGQQSQIAGEGQLAG